MGWGENIGISRLLLEQSTGSHWALDERREFVSASGACPRLFGLSAGELLGKPLSDVVPQPALDTWLERIDRVFEGESLLVREPGFLAGPSQPPTFSIAQFPLRSGPDAVDFAAGVAHDVTSWMQAERALRQASLRILRQHETDRARFAQFLHDEVGQSLSSVGIHLDLLRMDLHQDPAGASAHIAQIQEMLDGVMEQVRGLSYELNPSIVERAGLVSALEQFLHGVRSSFAGKVRLSVDGSIRVPAQVAAALFKIAREAVENCMHHAACSSIEVLVRSGQNEPLLEVRDDGTGFDAGDVINCRRGLGLIVMDHAAADGGLRLAISSGRGRGTTVRAFLQRDSRPGTS
jgi:PAS domain S-box-containing protein